VIPFKPHEFLVFNAVLYTQDGTKIGNAIIVDKVGTEYTCVTDYGNVCKLSQAEVLAYFSIGPVTPKDHKHYTRRGRCKTCGFHGCRILVNLERECVDCYTTARPL
jgi:hypothetical protein